MELIEREIAESRLLPGAKLPTEREWVHRTGHTRSVVRRSLAALEHQGRIVRHVGRGTFVAPLVGHSADKVEASGSSPSEIMAVRLLVEPASMPLVVAAARHEDFVEMERCLIGGEENQEFEAFERWDAAFHLSLAQATHNRLLTRICDMTNDARHQPLWTQLKRKSFTPERCRERIADHRRIAAALVDGDAEGAQVAMRDHLLRVRMNMLGP